MPVMMAEIIFAVANTVALISWILLIALPRWKLLLVGLKNITVLLMAVLYTVLAVYWIFFTPPNGGGFNTLSQVMLIFSTHTGTLLGWVHYLAFDLFIGLWIAAQSDKLGIHRIIQAPILFATFMLGPVGYVLFRIVRMTPLAKIHEPDRISA